MNRTVGNHVNMDYLQPRKYSACSGSTLLCISPNHRHSLRSSQSYGVQHAGWIHVVHLEAVVSQLSRHTYPFRKDTRISVSLC